MEQPYSVFPQSVEKIFSICNARIDEIQHTHSTVRFVFSKGFKVVENGNSVSASFGYIELSNCSIDNFSCHLVNRRKTKHGSMQMSYPISLDKMNNTMLRRQQEIEIYLELYDPNYLLWRGRIFPLNERGYNEYVEIGIGGNIPMSVYYE